MWNMVGTSSSKQPRVTVATVRVAVTYNGQSIEFKPGSSTDVWAEMCTALGPFSDAAKRILAQAAKKPLTSLHALETTFEAIGEVQPGFSCTVVSFVRDYCVVRSEPLQIRTCDIA